MLNEVKGRVVDVNSVVRVGEVGGRIGNVSNWEEHGGVLGSVVEAEEGGNPQLVVIESVGDDQLVAIHHYPTLHLVVQATVQNHIH